MRRAMTPQRHSTKAAQQRHLQPHRPPYNQRWAWKRGEEQFKRDGKKNTYTHTYKAASTSILPHSHRHTTNGPNARGVQQGWRAGPGSRAGEQGAMRWLHSVAALSPLQCQLTVKPGQSSAPSHHHHHHPAAPGGGSVLAGTASAKDTQCVDAAQPCFWNRCPNAPRCRWGLCTFWCRMGLRAQPQLGADPAVSHAVH